jgi:hypothetical protein
VARNTAELAQGAPWFTLEIPPPWVFLDKRIASAELLVFMVNKLLPSAKYWHGKNSFGFEGSLSEHATSRVLPCKSYEN